MQSPLHPKPTKCGWLNSIGGLTKLHDNVETMALHTLPSGDERAAYSITHQLKFPSRHESKRTRLKAICWLLQQGRGEEWLVNDLCFQCDLPCHLGRCAYKHMRPLTEPSIHLLSIVSNTYMERAFKQQTVLAGEKKNTGMGEKYTITINIHKTSIVPST